MYPEVTVNVVNSVVAVVPDPILRNASFVKLIVSPVFEVALISKAEPAAAAPVEIRSRSLSPNLVRVVILLIEDKRAFISLTIDFLSFELAVPFLA